MSDTTRPVRRSRDLALRAHPLVFGVVAFLASELMFFGGFIASYFNLRTLTTPWPPAGVVLDTGPSAVGTAMLALSDVGMMFTTHYLARGKIAVARTWLGGTILLGAGFLAIAIEGWIKDPFRIDSNAYGTIFYAMTGFHALHVTAGLFALVLLFASLHMKAFVRDQRAGVEAIGFYWHFVFFVWLVIWGTIYFIK